MYLISLGIGLLGVPCTGETATTAPSTRHAVDEIENLGGRVALSVDLSRTKVKDASIKCLEEFRQLEVLNLRDTEITDAGLSHLVRLTRLRTLILSGDDG